MLLASGVGVGVVAEYFLSPMAVGAEIGVPWIWYHFNAILCVGLFGWAALGGGRLLTKAVAGMLCASAIYALPFTGIGYDAAGVRHVAGMVGRPLALLEKVLPERSAEVWENDVVLASGPVREIDLTAVRDGDLWLPDVLFGCALRIEDGVVEGVWFRDWLDPRE